ncbi:30S ribosomal protein S11 [Candidatus Pacearchaeota archaeon]|nr:30S ribosomal protein S11 [Candidatus Pacearchaeota archaeon]
MSLEKQPEQEIKETKTKKIDKEIEVKQESKEDKSELEEVMEEKKDEKSGIAYIYSSSNNTQVHITDLAGNTLSRVSGGMMTKHSRLKADPTVAMFVAKKAAERARDLGVSALYIRTRAKTGSPGLGPGTHAAVKSLGKEGFRIISILDTTRVPRGGPKKKGGKRGRRV